MDDASYSADAVDTPSTRGNMVKKGDTVEFIDGFIDEKRPARGIVEGFVCVGQSDFVCIKTDDGRRHYRPAHCFEKIPTEFGDKNPNQRFKAHKMRKLANDSRRQK